MIELMDTVDISISDKELMECNNNPIAHCKKKVNGSIKAIGNLVAAKALGITTKEYKLQEEFALSLCSAYVYEMRDGRLAGIDTTVSTVNSDNILNHRLIVPAGQLYRHPDIAKHYTVGVFLACNKNDKNITQVKKASVAGWIRTGSLIRWIKKGGRPPFKTGTASVAIAPCSVLHPLPSLSNEIKWRQFCV